MPFTPAGAGTKQNKHDSLCALSTHSPVLAFESQGTGQLHLQYSHRKYEMKQMGTERRFCISNMSLGDAGTHILQVGDQRQSATLHPISKYKMLSQSLPKPCFAWTQDFIWLHSFSLSFNICNPVSAYYGALFPQSPPENVIIYAMGDDTASTGDLSATVPLSIECTEYSISPWRMFESYV